jgi:low affinity Fe/Cu permease
MLVTILLVVVVLMLLGTLPHWPHSRQWGYFPSAGVAVVLVILLVLMQMRRV